MRVLPVAVLSLFGFAGPGNAIVAEHTKYYYYDFAYTPGPITVEQYEASHEVGDGAIDWTFEYRIHEARMVSEPWLRFGFFITRSTHPEFHDSTFSFRLSSSLVGSGVDEYGREDYAYWVDSPWIVNDWDEHTPAFSGWISFDEALNITAWDIFAWPAMSDAFHATSTANGFSDDAIARNPSLAGMKFYTSTWHEPSDSWFATGKGSWTRTSSVFCWSHALDDEIACPEDPAGPTPIPLPASLPLLAGGLILLGAARRFRRTVS